MATRAGLAAKRPAAVRSRSSAEKIRISGQGLSTTRGAGLEGQRQNYSDSPSLMVPTPGCCARDDMGAALAGVFCGVLVMVRLELGTSMAAMGGGEVDGGQEWCGRREMAQKGVSWGRKGTYGAEMESIFLFRIGSDILAVPWCRAAGGGLLREMGVVGGRGRAAELFRRVESRAPGSQSPLCVTGCGLVGETAADFFGSG